MNYAISIVSRIASFFVKLLKKFLQFTGLWITLRVTVGAFIVLELLASLIGCDADNPIFNVIMSVCIIAGLIPALWICSQNLVRIVKKDFSWSEIIASRNKNIGFLSNEKGVNMNELHGIVFGKKGNKFIVQNEDTDGHIMVIGGAGSGKTTGVIDPTLQCWKGKALFIDIKPELYKKCVKARGVENICVFDPTDPDTYGYDPLYMLRKSDNPSQDAHMIADILIPVPIGSNTDPVWARGAQSIFVAATLYYMNEDPYISFTDLIKKIRLQAPADLIEMVAASDNELAKMEITDKIGADAKTIASFSSELQSLAIFASDTQLVSALNNSRSVIITPETIDSYDVCLRIKEEKLEVWGKLLNLIISQFLKSFEMRPNNQAQSTLVCIDECPRLGKIASLEHGLATLRSKGVKMLLVCQSKSQFDNIYGKDETKSIFDNCSRKIILRSTEPETQKYLSDMVGTYEAKTKSRSANTNAFGMSSGNGVSYSEQEKRIIKPEEFAYLGDELIYLSPSGYDRLTKIKSWQDVPFKNYMPD